MQPAAAGSSPMRFAPGPGETIELEGRSYTFDRDDAAPAFPSVFKDSSGRRAEIYRLVAGDGSRHALKVFRERFRDSELQNTVHKLALLRGLRGFRTAQRSILLETEPAVRRFPELRYAMLMPWLSTSTWSAILARAGAKQLFLRPAAAVYLAAHFLWVMEGLEYISGAHTDVASGNVTLDEHHLTIEMLDLEDLFFPGGTDCGNRGSPGYVHPAEPVVSCVAGDRYASAVLAAEMLILAHPALAAEAGEDGYFRGNRASSPGPDRFRAAEGWLERMAPEFARCFNQAWLSNSLEDCPRIHVLWDAMVQARRRMARHGPLLVPLSAGRRPSEGGPKVSWTGPGGALWPTRLGVR